MNQLKFSILIPTYNGEKVILDTLGSLLSQNFNNYEILIQDDVSTDKTVELIQSLKEERIRIFRNEKNLGYPKNLEKLSQRATGEIIYLMGQDDILGEEALLKTHAAFQKDENIGAVVRPYFWFQREIGKPVRATGRLNQRREEIIHISDDYAKVLLVLDVAGQLSGLALRRKYLDCSFNEDVFPCHVYPLASIFKKHPIVFLPEYTVAVRIESSQCRNLARIYDKSPIKSWVDFFHNVFPEKEFDQLRAYGIRNYVAKNYVGLIQIRNYAKFSYFLREIGYLLKYRPENIFSPAFWFFSLGTALVPPFILIPLVDWYKININSRRLEPIKFKYKIAHSVREKYENKKNY